LTTTQRSDPSSDPPVYIPGSSDGALGEFVKLQYAQELAVWLERWKQKLASDAARTALNASREDEDRAAEAALVKSLNDAYVAVTQSSIDRSLTRTNVVTASIGAVTTIYTGLLALVYAAKSGSGRPLTAAAIIPALFLGLALFLVTIYAAMFRNSSSQRGPLLPSGVGDPLVEYRLHTFMEWCFASVGARTWALHAGIVSLGLGVASLPIPFVKLTGWEQLAVLITGIVVVAGTGVITWLKSRGPQKADDGSTPDVVAF
jgi:hypothetical protein